MFTIIDGIRTLIDGNTLTSDQTQNVMEAIMDGQTDPTQIASFRRHCVFEGKLRI